MTDPTAPRPSIRFRSRSFLALVLAPESPLVAWYAELDAVLQRTPDFFAGRPAVLDLSAGRFNGDEAVELIATLGERGIRIMAIEGLAGTLPSSLPPALTGAWQTGVIEVAQADKGGSEAPVPGRRPSLTVQNAVRSGQSIIFPEGDVTIIGSVGSGAEVIAGGSIHIYGALRGRALAGTAGDAAARIFCRKLEAELMAIDGLYLTDDNMNRLLRGRPVQAWLDGDAMMMTALD